MFFGCHAKDNEHYTNRQEGGIEREREREVGDDMWAYRRDWEGDDRGMTCGCMCQVHNQQPCWQFITKNDSLDIIGCGDA